MPSETSHPLTRHLLALQQRVTRILRDPRLAKELRTASAEEAEAVSNGLLLGAGYLEDSVSNAGLGSPFHRDGALPINSMLEFIADAYGVACTVVSTTGTSALNAPAVASLATEGQSILIGRDSHASVIGGLVVSGATPVYVAPTFDKEHGVLLPPTASEVAAVLDEHPGCTAAVLTMPTYHGLMGDGRGIVDVCRTRGVRLMIDEAHGPHLHFLRSIGFPQAAEDLGADLVSQSTHKVLSALSQGSLLHFNDPNLLHPYEKWQATGFQTTSPSYPILISVEAAILQMIRHGPAMWGRAANLARRCREQLTAIDSLIVLDDGIVDGERVIGLDPTRITVTLRGCGVTGYELARALGEWPHNIIAELATNDVVLFLLGSAVDRMQVATLVNALATLLGPASRTSKTVFPPPPLTWEVVVPPRRGAITHTVRRQIPIAEAVGKVSGESISCYPPGWSVLVAGERITADVIEYLRCASIAGAHLKRDGVHEAAFSTLEVLD
jgi:arginine decarboxylase